MAVFTDLGQIKRFNNAVITIGTFDGVHEGHKAILREVVTHARAVGGESVLLTFEPHPRKVLFPEQPLGIITPLNRKLQLITETGIEHIVVVPFTKEFAALSAAEYIQQFLVNTFQPQSIVIGYDHHFGHDRTGNIELLREYAGTYGYEVIEISAQLIEHAAVSSTRIRKAIAAGNISDAGAMLGRPCSLEGIVVHGSKLGRTLGYPTANIRLSDPDQIIPSSGIYAVTVLVGANLHKGMMSIGYNPTVTDNRTELKLEVNILDFDGDLYNQGIEVFFIRYLRAEQKFNSLDELIAQLDNDKIAAIAAFG